MGRLRRVGRVRGDGGGNRKTRPRLEALESRVLLHAGHNHETDDSIAYFPANDSAEAQAGPVAAFPPPSGGTGGGGAKHPLSSLPKLTSLPNVKAKLFLDFDGFIEARWGQFKNIRTPAYDTDGDPSTFTDTELAAIKRIWEYVVEDYAPFNIDVTTIEPPSFANGVALRVAIGGNGNWTGVKPGGIAYIDSFTNEIPNTAYVFPKNLGNGAARYVAEASSHESGHSFGLAHQSEYDVNGRKVNEYYGGPGDGRAPIMGNSYSATRGVWWLGTGSFSPYYLQDDVAVIGRPANGFGMRPDDHGDTIENPDMLDVAGRTATGSGIIEKLNDTDVFGFRSSAGVITMTVSGPMYVRNLDVKLELRTDKGQLLAAVDPPSILDATIKVTLPAAGDYRLLVMSHGTYGDLGQYAIVGSINTMGGGGGTVMFDGNSAGASRATSADETVTAGGDSTAGLVLGDAFASSGDWAAAWFEGDTGFAATPWRVSAGLSLGNVNGAMIGSTEQNAVASRMAAGAALANSISGSRSIIATPGQEFELRPKTAPNIGGAEIAFASMPSLVISIAPERSAVRQSSSDAYFETLSRTEAENSDSRFMAAATKLARSVAATNANRAVSGAGVMT